MAGVDSIAAVLPRAVLFDLDGVLVKSFEVWFRAVEEAGRRFRHGRAVTRDEFAPTFGQGTAADIEVFGLFCTREELDRFYEVEFCRHLDAVWVNPDAKPVLDALGRAGVRRALVTNTVGGIVRELLPAAGLAGCFEALATADRVPRSKPAPDLLQLACRELDVQPADAWMVGDSIYDRDAAAAAGVPFFGFHLDGPRKIERLTQLLSP